MIFQIIGKNMSQQSIDTNPDLSALLLFQDNFITLLHTHVFHKPSAFQQTLLNFQIHHISNANDQLARMIHTLTAQLINQRHQYQLSLRDCFQRLLQADYLPLLRINRFEFTKLSLFGFDIYVEPLQAVLQILSRLDVIKKRIIESTIPMENIVTSQKALQNGWDTYMAYADQWKLSFNLYILQQYLRVGGKSFLKKDREILFTGISNLYSQLVPALHAKKNYKVLKEFAALNNSLYHFHLSYNYFQLYTLLFPLTQQLQTIFGFMTEIAEKCFRTNILTPLLFGVLRHREAFLRFIKQADSPIWLPYLNVLISGIAINLKFRILQYEEIIQIFENAACKAGLLGTLRTVEIFGTLEDGWRDAKQFFISAVKIGFNSGQVQTWKVIQFQAIGPRIINSIINGLLLNPEQNQQLYQYLTNYQQKLQIQINKLSLGKLDWKIINNSICDLQRLIDCEQQFFNLIRIVNLIDLMKQSNEYNLHFVISSILSINFQLKPVFKQALERLVDKINKLLFTLNVTFLKDIIIKMHKKYPPTNYFNQIISFYFSNFQPKKCISALLSVLPIQTQKCCDLLGKYISQKFIPKPSSKLVKIRTFQQQLLVKNDLVNTPYETHCLLSVLAMQMDNNSSSIIILIEKIIAASPWISFSLLNFPINDKGKIYSMGNFLVQSPRYHNILRCILINSEEKIFSQEGIDFIKTLTYPNICQQLCKKINQLQDVDVIYPYLHFLLWLLAKFKESDLLCKDLLANYLYLLQKTTRIQIIEAIIKDIPLIAHLAFRDKVDVWLAFLMGKRIEAKLDLQRTSKKRPLKSTKSNVYFINQILDKQSIIIQHHFNKSAENQIQNQQNSNLQIHQIQILKFWANFDKLDKQGLTGILKVIQKQNIIFQQQLKILYVPQLSAQVMKIMSQNLQNSQYYNILRFISLNTQNYLKLIDQAVTQKNITFLSKNRFIGRLSSKMSNLLHLQMETGSSFLKEMSIYLSAPEQQRIAEDFFLQTSILLPYFQNIEGIQYFAVFNHTNWRILIQYINRQFARFNLPSVLLQYSQYLNITAQSNHQYQSTIASQTHLFHQYVSLFSLKLSSILTLSTSQEELQLKSVNELSSLNLVVSSLQLKEVAIKLGLLHRSMKQRGINYEHSWVQDLQKLNNIINTNFGGNVIPADFTNGYYLTNEDVLFKYKTEVGVILQLYYWSQGKAICSELFYQPFNLSKSSVKQLSRNKNSIIDNGRQQPVQTLKEQLQQILNQLTNKECIIISENEWDLIYENTSSGQEVLDLFYKLGVILGCFDQKQKLYMPLLFKQLIKRQKLSWQVLKSIRSDEYHYIKSILVEPQIANRQIYFFYQDEQLVPDGKSLKVNQYNRQNYCQKIGQKVIGANALNCARHFLHGYTNQKAYK